MFFPRPWVFLKKMSGWLADEGLSNEDLEVILHAARAQEPVFMMYPLLGKLVQGGGLRSKIIFSK